MHDEERKEEEGKRTNYASYINIGIGKLMEIIKKYKRGE
jgi:hypothetical protein